MTSRFVAGIIVACLLPAGYQLLSAAPQTARTSCSQLTALRLPDVRISEAVVVPAATAGQIRAAHCRVTGVIGTEIRFSLTARDPNRATTTEHS
jgi:hypothetical protein